MTSLTAPWDRDENTKQTVSRGVVLTEDEVQEAVATNVDTGITDKFPKVDRLYADPIYNNQMYCLHSFVPSKGAQPDEKGVFGFMKIRGAFQTIDEANQRAEFIIRNVDSYHDIQTGYCGRPFPVCVDTKKFVKETHEVDIRKEAVKTISEDIKQKRLDEKKEIDEIKERESKLLEDSKAAQEDTYEQEPLEQYTTLHVKKANLVFTYVETRKKMMDMQKSIQNAYQEIRDMDQEDSTLATQYYDKYMEARRAAHIPDEMSENNWMKYLCEDAELDFEY
jgi:hypothetical protein